MSLLPSQQWQIHPFRLTSTRVTNMNAEKWHQDDREKGRILVSTGLTVVSRAVGLVSIRSQHCTWMAVSLFKTPTYFVKAVEFVNINHVVCNSEERHQICCLSMLVHTKMSSSQNTASNQAKWISHRLVLALKQEKHWPESGIDPVWLSYGDSEDMGQQIAEAMSGNVLPCSNKILKVAN